MRPLDATAGGRASERAGNGAPRLFGNTRPRPLPVAVSQRSAREIRFLLALPGNGNTQRVCSANRDNGASGRFTPQLTPPPNGDFLQFLACGLPIRNIARELRRLVVRSAARFTVIELMMVLVVILILIALLFPGMMRSKEMAYSVECVHHQRQLIAALSRHSLNADGMLPEPASWMNYVAGLGHDMDRTLICPKGGGFSGNIEVEKIPKNLNFHKVQNSTKMRAYLERANYVLPKAQAVQLTAPGT
ncbi:MAG: hypothetical protein ACI8W8_000940 [Rhodothermales bacterium]|jgi:hypothetical protein